MLPPLLQETLDDLALLDDRQERIEYLISLSEGFTNPTQEELPRTPETRVPGCESEVYVGQVENELRIAVDNPQGISAMALANLLQDSFAAASPDQIQSIPEDVVYQVFGRELSMGKSMGLTGIVRLAKQVAGR